MSKKQTTPTAVVKEPKNVKVLKEKRGITRKEQVAIFLDKKPFLNSRVAFREFKKINPTVAIKQTYFYTLFKSFGTRVKRSSLALTIISVGGHKNCMSAYKQYTKEVTSGTPISFAYFLNLWKKHFKLTGYLRRKPKTEKKAKVKTTTVVEVKIVELSTLSAKGIIAKANELLKTKAKVLPTNLKNKAGIVKKATQLFSAAGYQVA